MTANRSLLAHLSRRLSGQTEDLAVESLGHILSTSAASRQALTDVLGNCGVEIGGISRVETQSTGGGGERPDLAGFDESGQEKLLIEAKFWAGLTGNQPVAYLDRLPQDSPSALLVVAPSLRIDTLWAELRRRVRDAKGIDIGDGQPGAELRHAPVGVSRRLVITSPAALSLGDGNRQLILTSWRNLLGRMEAQANAAGDVSTLNNLQQLQGLAELEDTEAFLPLRPEQLSAEFPRLLPHLIGLTNDTVARLRGEGLAYTSGYRFTTDNNRLVQYMTFCDVPNTELGIDYAAWRKYHHSPIWLKLRIGELRLDSPWRSADPPGCEKEGGSYLFPVYLKTGVERDSVLDSMMEQLRAVARLVAPEKLPPQ